MPKLTNVSILVVDDDADVCDLLTLLFMRAGAEVRAASRAADALALFAQSKPDIIVSDIAMPEVDGYSFMRQIRSRTGDDGGQIPAVAITARSGANDRIRALRAGYQSYVPKPIDQEEMLTVVETLVTRVSGRDRSEEE